MNRRIIVALSCLALAGLQSLQAAEGDSLWSRTFGGSSFDIAPSVIEIGDGDFLLAGFTTSFGSGSSDMWLVKADAQGDSLWSFPFGGNLQEKAYSVIETSDGGFLLAGFAESFGSDSEDMWLVKTSAQGDSLWSRTFGGDDQDICNCVIETGDGGFLLGGLTYSFGSGSSDMWLVKTNAQGDSLWSRTYGGVYQDVCNCVIETGDGGFLLGGLTISFGSGNYDMWLVKTNAQGDSLWSRTYGGSFADRCNRIIETGDGGFLLAGATNSFGLGSSDMWLVKTNSQGDTLWSNTFGSVQSDAALSLIENAEGCYLLAGYQYYMGSGWDDMLLVKTDPMGELLWSHIYGGSGYDEAYDIIESSNGDYLLAGYTDSYGSGGGDIWIVCIQGVYLPDIELSTSQLDFGSVTIGESANLPLMIYNVGNDTLVLFNLACGLTAFSTNWNPSDSLVLPGNSLEITVTFAPDDTLDYADTLCVENNCERCEVELSGQGAAVGIFDLPSGLPKEFALRGPYPNPFNPVTTFKIELPRATWVKLEIYDIGGKSAATILEGWRPAGHHEVSFDGNGLSSGVYLYRLNASDFAAAGKIVMLK